MAKTRNPANENTTSTDFAMLSGIVLVMVVLSVIIAFLGLTTTDSLLRRDCDRYNQAQACRDLAGRVLVSTEEAVALEARAEQLESQ